MPVDINGRYYPALSPRQIEVYNDRRRHLLLTGPRLCGKTIVAVHKIIKHCYLVDNARAGIFVKSTKVGVSGVWSDLCDYAIPLWCSELEQEGFKIVEGPAIRGDTRQRFIRISNIHGGVSEISLNSLHHDESVVEKMKGTRWSALYFDEVDVYESPEVFEISVLQLRAIGVPYNQHLWLGTANPPEEGQEHWLYRRWFVDTQDERIDKSDRESFGLYEFTLFDNPYLKPEEIARLKATYINDPQAYDRFVNGKWVADIRKAHFAGAFLQNQHVRGSIDEGTIILPSDTSMVYVGWDMGSRNHAVSFLQRTTHSEGDYWAVLDEISYIDTDTSVESLTIEVVAKMRELDKLAGKPLKYKHWSDTSAFDYRSTIDGAEQALVLRYSKGEIELLGAPKGPHSVAARIALTRQLLIQKRLYISANCVDTIEMFKKLSKGKTKAEPIKRDKTGHIHRFDALSYVLIGEHIDEIDQSFRPKLIERPKNFCL